MGRGKLFALLSSSEALLRWGMQANTAIGHSGVFQRSRQTLMFWYLNDASASWVDAELMDGTSPILNTFSVFSHLWSLKANFGPQLLESMTSMEISIWFVPAHQWKSMNLLFLNRRELPPRSYPFISRWLDSCLTTAFQSTTMAFFSLHRWGDLYTMYIFVISILLIEPLLS